MNNRLNLTNQALRDQSENKISQLKISNAFPINQHV